MTSFVSLLLYSSILGFTLTVGIVLLLKKYPGKPFNYGMDGGDNKKNDDSGSIASEEDTSPFSDPLLKNLSDDEMVIRFAALKDKLGLTDEQLKQSIRDAKAKYDKPKHEMMGPMDDGKSAVRMADSFIHVCMLIAGFYAMNLATNGELMGFVSGLLPREYEAFAKAGTKLATWLQ